MARPLLAEAIGTFFLLTAIVGSGIMGTLLAGDAPAAILLSHSIAIGAVLAVFITLLGPVSGAHFNPAVTFAFWLRGQIGGRQAAAFATVQVAAAIGGVLAAHAMFEQDLVQVGLTVRSGPGQWLAETVATFGLVFVIFGGLNVKAGAIPWMVGVYITAAIWFTASTSFANPAVTIARALTDTFTAIRPGDVIPFLLAQLAGGGMALPVVGALWPDAAKARPPAD